MEIEARSRLEKKIDLVLVKLDLLDVRLDLTDERMKILTVKQELIMTKLSDINDALDGLGASLTDQLTAIQTEIQQLVDAGGGDQAGLQAVLDKVNTMKSGVDASIDQLKADDPATP